MKKQLSLSKPDITDKEIEYVNEVLRSGILSIGPKIEQFEEMIANYVGVKYAIAVNSGTSALHLIIRALGIKEGDEVITTLLVLLLLQTAFYLKERLPCLLI